MQNDNLTFLHCRKLRKKLIGFQNIEAQLNDYTVCYLYIVGATYFVISETEDRKK